MILMFHHVCPGADVPRQGEAHAIEGWEYNLAPEDFRFQLESLRGRGFEFVSMSEYVSRAVDADEGPGRMVTVTFDDGWADNYIYAVPVLVDLGIPATFFVVSGEWVGVPSARRMSPAMLRELVATGMTIGGHSRTHPNLARVSEAQLQEEIGGCKDDLEAVTGQPVQFLAYPGGRFNDAVVECAASYGFSAACSVIPAGHNTGRERFWLSRDVFSPRLGTLRDRLLLRPAGRWAWRAARSARAALEGRRESVPGSIGDCGPSTISPPVPLEARPSEAILFKDYDELAGRVGDLLSDSSATSLSRLPHAGWRRVLAAGRDYPSILSSILADARLSP